MRCRIRVEASDDRLRLAQHSHIVMKLSRSRWHAFVLDERGWPQIHPWAYAFIALQRYGRTPARRHFPFDTIAMPVRESWRIECRVLWIVICFKQMADLMCQGVTM